MAKKASGKPVVAKGKGRPAQGGKLTGVLARSSARSSARSEGKRSATPRGAVSAKPIGRVRTFFREVRIEMKKVTWPTRKELLKSTGVVIIAVAIAAAFIGVFDLLWKTVVEAVGLGG
jgi:preprotein translocase subunit SecE